MPSPPIRTALIALLLGMASASHAQAQSIWPQPGTHADYGTVEVITLSDPGHRHYCRVHAITPDTITCGIGAARKPVLYHRDDVAAILTPVHHPGDQILSSLGVTAAVTVLFAASVIASPAVPLAILASAIAYAIYSAISPHPSWRSEEVLYQRPNTPLAVVLRNH